MIAHRLFSPERAFTGIDEEFPVLFRVLPRLLAIAALALCLISFGGVMLLNAEARSPRPGLALSGPVVTQISLQQSGDAASLVIDLSEEVRAQVSAMLEPRRLLLDFSGVRFHAPSVKVAERDGLIRDLRFGAFMTGQGRIVLDLGRPAQVLEQTFVPLAGGGARLVVLFKATTQDLFQNLARPVVDDIITGTVDAKAAPSSLPLIVLDPGHGGIDTGATGPSGESEKAIVLQFALALKERLEASGKARVLMTRSTDVFVPLRDRVRMARQAKAQLFISLHADALPDEENVRGASIYVLSERATDERSARLADKENRADLIGGIDAKDDQDEVADILFDLARRESRAFSNQFARQLATTLPKATRMHKTPLRGAAFRVLRAPDVPSVLIELGYLTTVEDAKLMQTEEWRRETTNAAAEAIERFIAERIDRERNKP
jgi:N-acetylmuramoyl-L-alanine amidase